MKYLYTADPAILISARGKSRWLQRSTVLFTIGAIGQIASAQNNSRDYGRPVDSPENRADAVVLRAAYCTTMKASASARHIVEAEIGSEDEAKQVRKLPGVVRECFDIKWPDFPPTTFRNALAEVAYRASYSVNDPDPPVAGAAPPASFGVVPPGKKGTPEQEVAWQLAAIANCAVFVRPNQARQLILGPRNVDEEQRRFTAFLPALKQCVAAEDASVLTARNFRGFVANALLERTRRATSAKTRSGR
jgi:hypothetical protein